MSNVISASFTAASSSAKSSARPSLTGNDELLGHDHFPDGAGSKEAVSLWEVSNANKRAGSHAMAMASSNHNDR